MTFSEFIGAIFRCFTDFFTHIDDITLPFIENNFIKLIIFLTLLSFIIYLLFEILNILYTILNLKHDKNEEIKMISGESDTKKEKGKHGDNIRKKDIYW